MDSSSATSAEPTSAPPSFKTALLPAMKDLGLPVFLFGAVFLLLTVSMTRLLSPDRFPVHAAGKVIRLSDLAEEQRRLHEEEDALTIRRQELIASQDAAPVLTQIAERSKEIFPIGPVLLGIEALRASFTTNSLDPIALPVIDYNASENMLRLGGHVTDPTGGSSHLLAAFVDGLRSLPRVASVSEPEYRQERGEDGTLRTPFTLTIRFTDAL